MLREILSITGRPGLFKILSHGNKMIIVEDITTKKRFPALQRDKIVSLGDIAMYTDSDDKPLNEILEEVYANMKGSTIDVKQLVESGKLKEKFAEIIPNFDAERVHDNDIKKLFSWYNLLVNAGWTEFTKKEEEDKKDSQAEA